MFQRTHSLSRPLSAIASVVLCLPAAVHAQAHRFTLSGAVSSVNPAAPGFLSVLADVTVGTGFTATIGYEYEGTPDANAFGGIFAPASYYRLVPTDVSITVGAHALTGWTFPIGLAAFVWNDDAGPGSDGLLFINPVGSADPQFQVGNLLLGAATFASQALPTQSVPGGFLLTLGLGGNGTSWLQGSGMNLSFSAPVPEAPAASLLAAGLMALALRRRLAAQAVT